MIGKNGVSVQGTLYTPVDGQPTGGIQLHSQDYVQIGDRAFYFLLPRGDTRCEHFLSTNTDVQVLNWHPESSALTAYITYNFGALTVLQARSWAGRSGSKASAVRPFLLYHQESLLSFILFR